MRRTCAAQPGGAVQRPAPGSSACSRTPPPAPASASPARPWPRPAPHLLPQVGLGQMTGCVYLNCCSTSLTTAGARGVAGRRHERKGGAHVSAAAEAARGPAQPQAARGCSHHDPAPTQGPPQLHAAPPARRAPVMPPPPACRARHAAACSLLPAPVMHSMQRKVPVKSSGRTSVVRVTVPTNWLSLPTRLERSSRRRSLSGRP